jgi:hypothetical protein
VPVAGQTAADDQLILELVKRVKDFDMAKASPKVLAAVSRSLESTRGSKSYFEFVQRYKVATEAPHLLKMAMERPDKPEAGSAFQTLFAIGMGDAIKPLLLKTPKEQLPAVGDAIVLSQRREAVDLLMGTITDPAATPEYRQSVVKSLGRSRNGELALLAALKENALPMDVLYFSSQILHGSSDASVRENAEKLLPTRWATKAWSLGLPSVRSAASCPRRRFISPFSIPMLASVSATRDLKSKPRVGTAILA